MTSLRTQIPDDVRRAQAQASDPATSAFVAANAGAGKTHVLVARVIRLLLSGVAPHKILCITFTKAAAANMAERVFGTLGRWVGLDDKNLDEAIRAVGAGRIDAATRRRARELFARALDTPGGLKVQTIHALCARLLQQFPFEAGVSARFAVIEDRDRADMIERASLAVLLAAADDPEGAAGRALRVAMDTAADVTFRDLVRDACIANADFRRWTERAPDPAVALVDLSRALGVAPDETVAAIDDAICNGPDLPLAQWTRIAALCEGGGPNDNKQAERLRDALAASGAMRIEKYLEVFYTGQGGLRKAFITKPLAKAQPALAAALDRESARIESLLAQRHAAAMRDRTHALFTIASAVSARYRREKRERGLLDYDDLIDTTLRLLESTSAGWVHYKLDRGIDHVLIDEAQDTSPQQWDIVERLIAEFASGEGARTPVHRTVFAVGDEKQSIFSFQGAAPRELEERQRSIRKRFEEARLAFARVVFDYSFRSGESVLRAVEGTFSAPDVYRSITSDAQGMARHLALADAAPAMVDLWDLQPPEPRLEIEPWQAPLDAVSETSPEVLLAGRMAREMRRMLEEDHTGRRGQRRRLRAGDILVLVRRRGTLFDAVIRALKQTGIPVAGADRLKLTEHIAVIDLMNLADALLLPQDDLALAVALKSPLFGLSEEQMFALAHGRAGSLRRSLQDKAQTDSAFAAAAGRLAACESRARTTSPFALFSWLLGADGARARMLARLGIEANDALDEFLELALAFEQRETASLQGFMAWLRAADIEIKRDMEMSRDEVRVMTVHGAKGLEAPVVFLMDTTSSPPQRTGLIALGGCVVWAGRKGEDPPAVAAARERLAQDGNDEYRRLLYVALTRAAERLVIGGCMPGNRKEPNESWWYDLVRNGLDASALEMETLETPDGRVRRYRRAQDRAAPPLDLAATPAEPPPPATPAWLRAPHAPSTAPARPGVLRPSDSAGAGAPSAAHSGPARREALRRGALAHRLLQSLPDIAAERRADAAARFLARHAPDWDDAARGDLAQRMLALIAAPLLAPAFAPGSRAEVALVGRIERPPRAPLRISGQVDRLAIGPDAVLIVDYKTDHAPPAAAAQVPPAYLRQLALYRALLRSLYPQRRVRTALIWTESAEMMELSDSALDHEMSAIISA
jgi:ATP-dependent helicase/nuclease subunit A